MDIADHYVQSITSTLFNAVQLGLRLVLGLAKWWIYINCDSFCYLGHTQKIPMMLLMMIIH